MTISKAHWDTEGENVRLSMPFSKVDQERRIVSGFATLDNVDKQADIVTAEASVKAFSKFRGNIREMHQPLAVGKMVNFKEDKYFDPETKKFYSGVYVSAYVSKGAQDTWEKVLDGTLSGFSIGGRMNKWDDGFDTKSEAKIRIIKDYDLVELSLVDTPANQFANILSVEKVDGADVLKGEIMDVALENVFWDKDSGIVTVSEEEVAVSPVSGLPMQNIGFVEKSDDDKADMVKFLVESASGTSTEINKEVSPMAEATEAVEETVVEKSEVAPEVDAAVEETATEEVSVEKADSEEVDVEKADAEVEVEKAESVEGEETVEAVEESADEISKSDEAVVEAVAEIKSVLTSAFSDLADTVKSLQEQINTVTKSVDAVTKEVNDAKSEFNEFGKRVDAVEADTAFRKSGDLGEIVQDQPEMVEKSLWGGRFLKTADLFR
jgi:hypothetical protein